MAIGAGWLAVYWKILSKCLGMPNFDPYHLKREHDGEKYVQLIRTGESERFSNQKSHMRTHWHTSKVIAAPKNR